MASLPNIKDLFSDSHSDPLTCMSVLMSIPHSRLQVSLRLQKNSCLNCFLTASDSTAALDLPEHFHIFSLSQENREKNVLSEGVEGRDAPLGTSVTACNALKLQPHRQKLLKRHIAVHAREQQPGGTRYSRVNKAGLSNPFWSKVKVHSGPRCSSSQHF